MDSNKETLRTFIAVETGPAVRAWLEGCLGALRAGRPAVKWVGAEHLHLTVKFLGDVPAARIETVAAAARSACAAAAPFRLEIAGPGSFGPRRAPRTLWLGFVPGEGLDRLLDLQRSLEAALAAEGFPKEDRPFSPHLTLGRNPRGAAVEGWEGLLLPPPAEKGFPVDSLALFSSTLTSKGPIHRLLEEIPIGVKPGPRP